MTIFFTLILIRFFKDRINDKKILRKKEIEQQLFIHLAKPLKDLKTVLLKTDEDMRLVAEIAPRLLRTLKGNSYKSLLDSLQSIELYEWALVKLRSRSPSRKVAAINLIAHWSNKHVKQELKALLRDDHPLVQRAAVDALAFTRDTSIVPTIIKEFERQGNFSIPLMSDVFQKFGRDISKQLSVLLASKDVPAKIKISALMALTKIGDTAEIMTTASSLCCHIDNELRALAYLAISGTGESIAVEIMQSGANDNDWRVRQFVAKCAGNCEPLPAEILSKLLKDENWLVALHSGQVLIASGVLGRKILETIAKKNDLSAGRARMILAEHGHTQHGTSDGLA
jgi:HEAT repeat protein